MTKTLKTKGDVNRLGERIRKEYPEISDKTKEQIQEYRITFKESTNKTFNALCSLSKRVDKNAIITYRLKRIESIIGKLQRLDKKQKFSRMWDISGCRCIVDNDRQVYKLVKLLSKKFIVRGTPRDYIKNPKSNGYKSIHLYLQSKDDENIVEVQIRNRIDHNWATLVEITDLIFDSQLKELNKDKKLEKFLLFLSKRKDITYEEQKYIAKILREYNYFQKLSNVFTRNYLEVRNRWLELESFQNHKFFLIETRKDEIPKIDSFDGFYKAEKEYFIRYLNKDNSNIVLTHLTKPSYKNISSAYSNYILTVHSVLDDIEIILRELIVESFIKRKYFSFLKYYHLYVSIYYKHINNLNSEILLSNKHISIQRKNKQKLAEWKRDINMQREKMLKNFGKLYIAVNKYKGNNKIRNLLLNIGIKMIVIFNKTKLKKN